MQEMQDSLMINTIRDEALLAKVPLRHNRSHSLKLFARRTDCFKNLLSLENLFKFYEE